MTLLKLSKLDKTEEGYFDMYYGSFWEKRARKNSKYSPINKTLKKCQVINFYTHIFPHLAGKQKIDTKYLRYYYGEFISCVLALDERGFRRSFIERRLRSFKATR